jgi:pyruvyl transferase EpsO
MSRTYLRPKLVTIARLRGGFYLFVALTLTLFIWRTHYSPQLSLQSTFIHTHLYTKLQKTEPLQQGCSTEAYITLLNSKDAFQAALNLAFSLKMVHETSKDCVLLHTVAFSDEEKTQLLLAGFSTLLQVDPIVPSATNCSSSGTDSSLSASYVTNRDFELIYSWNLTYYSKVIYLHVTTVLDQSPDHLFWKPTALFTAASSNLFTDLFDPSFIILEPSTSMYAFLRHSIEHKQHRLCSTYFILNDELGVWWGRKDEEERLSVHDYVAPSSSVESDLDCNGDHIKYSMTGGQVTAISGLLSPSLRGEHWQWSKNPCIQQTLVETETQVARYLAGNDIQTTKVHLGQKTSRTECREWSSEASPNIPPTKPPHSFISNTIISHDNTTGKKEKAFITFLRDINEYNLRKAQVLIQSMKETSKAMQSIPFLIAVPQNITKIDSERLGNAGYIVWKLQLVALPNDVCKTLWSYHHLWHIFQNWEYETFVYIQVESVILQDISYLFDTIPDRNHIAMSQKLYFPDMLLDSVMVYSPSLMLWNAIYAAYITGSRLKKKCLKTESFLHFFLFEWGSNMKAAKLTSRDFVDVEAFEHEQLSTKEKNILVSYTIRPGIVGYHSANGAPFSSFLIRGKPLSDIWNELYTDNQLRIIRDFTESRQESLLAIRDEIVRGLIDLIPSTNNFGLVDFPDHPNVGDHAIWLGEETYFSQLGLTPLFTCSSYEKGRYNYAKHSCDFDSLRQVVGENGTIFCHGGGNIRNYPGRDTLGFYEHFRETLLAEFHSNRIVILPQSVNFQDSHPEALKTAQNAYESAMNVTMILRDAESYKFVQENFPDIQARLLPDMAFMIGPIPQGGVPPEFNAVWIRRQDSETMFKENESERVKTPRDILEVDWKYIPYNRLDSKLQTSTLRVGQGIHLLRKGHVVITDRLHGMILALLLRKPIIALDNDYGKLSRFYNTFLKRVPGIYWAQDEAEALELCRKLVNAYTLLPLNVAQETNEIHATEHLLLNTSLLPFFDKTNPIRDLRFPYI